MARLRQATGLLLAAWATVTLGSPVQHASSNNDSTTSRPLLQNFDALGAWFDGVAAINHTEIPRRPNVTIAIVGGGVTGLATGLMLDSIGVHNWEIIEASDRVGGRFRTIFVGDTEEYAEMGPMRLPHSVTYKSDNSTHFYSDHQMTFQLADWLNELNDNDPKWKVNFIPWIQHHPNELLARGTSRHPDGTIPTRVDIAANSSLGTKAALSTMEYKDTKAKMDGILKNEATMKDIQRDIWRVHKKFMDEGYDDVSQQAMMRNVWQVSENVTDAIWTASDYDIFWDEAEHNSNLALDGSPSSLGETEWKCVDGGFNRLSDAFLPHVSNRLHLNRKITTLDATEDADGRTQTRLSWFEGSGKNRTTKSKTYDYTIMAVPFTMTRFMSLPTYSSVLGRAISEAGLRFKSACKVSVLFSERFWEKGERPIFGGYSQPESAAVGALYYPVYGLNETGRPGLITHYRGGDWSDRFVALTDQQHVDLVLDAIVSLHGEEVRELYTGDYARLCWLQDEHTATSWTRPDVEQHKLYIPAYHKTEHHTIFVGEHTAPTHAWISSSLHSAARGTVQLLLELGMVEEAKEINQRWFGRWINLRAE
ncbi:putative amine oxidase, FAD/NAD(P)-binding domain superfamily [Septoria linicola]|nr:putative amine oxidase, FAD/NAD(P)-binding domain superfamily [Septoria linicola]